MAAERSAARLRGGPIWVAPLLLASCVLGHTPPSTSPPEAPLEEPVQPPPPECRANATRCTWSAGHWHWDGGGYVWIPGRWEGGNQYDLVSDSGS